jgi:hypothetical protein
MHLLSTCLFQILVTFVKRNNSDSYVRTEWREAGQLHFFWKLPWNKNLFPPVYSGRIVFLTIHVHLTQRINESVKLYFIRTFSRCTHNFAFFWQWHSSPWWTKASALSKIHNHTQTQHTWRDSSGRVINPTQGSLAANSHETDIHIPGGIRIHNPCKRAAAATP